MSAVGKLRRMKRVVVTERQRWVSVMVRWERKRVGGDEQREEIKEKSAACWPEEEEVGSRCMTIGSVEE